MTCICTAEEQAPGSWTFVGIFDFLNVDTLYPEPKWEDALSCTLKSISDYLTEKLKLKVNECEQPDGAVIQEAAPRAAPWEAHPVKLKADVLAFAKQENRLWQIRAFR